MIAMSWPSQGSESLYRNKMEDVASFLDSKHPNHYKVYNLCSERTYTKEHFHGRMERVKIDDHQPCDLTMLYDFCISADAYLKEDPKNVVIVHCKGGKGRTGMMCCTYMVWSGLETDIMQARQRFGIMRTEINSPKTQTVESPSQNVYLKYFEACLVKEMLDGKLCVRFRPPEPRRLQLSTVTIGPLPKMYLDFPHKLVAGLVNGTQGDVLWASKQITCENKQLSSPTKGSTNVRTFSRIHSQEKGKAVSFGNYRMLVATDTEKLAKLKSYKTLSPQEYRRACDQGELQGATYNAWLQYDLSHVAPFCGDTRFHVTRDNTSWSESVVWTWFHTSFVNVDEGLLLRRPDVDGAHKDNEHKKYSPEFVMQLNFTVPADEAAAATTPATAAATTPLADVAQ